MATYNTFVASELIGPNLSNVDTTAQFPLGTICKVKDLGSTGLGIAEAIYLAGVASTVEGSVVIFDQRAGTTTLATAGSRGPVAVALAPTVANTFGWYLLAGSVAVKETGATAGGNVYATGTAGTVSPTTVVGDKVDGMRFKSADGTPASGFAWVQMDRPSMNANG